MHLFAGIGGGLLADLILGHQPVVAVEWEPYACRVLRERAADGWFPGLHVWEGDVRLFDPSEYTGKVDCIHAGFPCQDISVAGKQAGVSEGTRSGLYREVLRIAGVVRPKQLFLENVSAILSNGLGTVLGDLAALGYDTRWLCIRASDVGAPHHRDRWFLLANANSHGSQGIASGCLIDKKNGDEPWSTTSRAGYEDFQYATCAESARQREHSGEILPISEAERFDFGCRNEWWTTEPGLGGLVDGFSNRICTSEGEINANAINSSAEQDLQNLRHGIQQKSDAERTETGCETVFEAGILQPFMREHTGHIHADGSRVLIQGKETPEKCLRGLRLHEVASRTPCGSGQDEQPAGQHPDSLQALSRLLAHGAEADGAGSGGEDASALWWAKEPTVGRVATGIPNRVGQLKGYGNAQVPLQAATAYRLLGGI
jgi:DNA (cytosine-5)-methyltransferase 1